MATAAKVPVEVVAPMPNFNTPIFTPMFSPKKAKYKDFIENLLTNKELLTALKNTNNELKLTIEMFISMFTQVDNKAIKSINKNIYTVNDKVIALIEVVDSIFISPLNSSKEIENYLALKKVVSSLAHTMNELVQLSVLHKGIYNFDPKDYKKIKVNDLLAAA